VIVSHCSFVLRFVVRNIFWQWAINSTAATSVAVCCRRKIYANIHYVEHVIVSSLVSYICADICVRLPALFRGVNSEIAGCRSPAGSSASVELLIEKLAGKRDLAPVGLHLSVGGGDLHAMLV